MTAQKDELVVVLHGIGMSALRMALLDRGLKKAGYQTLNINYPSHKKTIEDSADFVQEKIDSFVQDRHSKIHFAAHSLGTLITLNLLARNHFKNAARAVLIAPPYGGSEAADWMEDWRLFNTLFGPAGRQLTTRYRKDITFDLPDHVEVGVVAGTTGWEYPHMLYAMRHAGIHDGLVSVKSTRLPRMKDHITIRMGHSLLIEKSIAQTIHFLDHGRFKPVGTAQQL